jgi:hypothetical protein
MVVEMVAGPPDELGNGLLNCAGRAINVAVAERAMRRRPARKQATPGRRAEAP